MVSTAEDAEILNFIVGNLHLAYPDKKSKWESLRFDMSLTNCWATAYWRFQNHLLPQLENALLPTEDKLKLCKEYKVPMRAEFFRKVQDEADVTLSEIRTVTSYKMKVETYGNRPEISANSENRQYTPEEDQEIWDHVLGNYETAHCLWSFWKDCAEKNGRSADSDYLRFNTYLGMKIHEQDFEIETKLKIYQWCQVPANKEFLDTLKDQAKVQMQNGRVIGYEMIGEGQKEKRKKPADETGTRAKRARIDGDNNEVVEFESSPKAIPQVVAEVTKLLDGAMSTFSGKIDTFHEELTAINKTITAKMDNYDEKLTNISKEVGEVSSKIDFLKEQVVVSRKEISSESAENDEESEPTKKAYLQMLKDYLAVFKTKELEDIRQRIDVALQNPLDDFAGPDRKKVIRSALEKTLLMLTGNFQ